MTAVVATRACGASSPAVMHAVAGAGPRHGIAGIDLPACPERVGPAIQAAKGGAR